MLKIGDTQYETIARAQEEAFVALQATRLREDFGRQHVNVEAAERAVRAGLARARGWGIRYREDLVLYLDCMMLLGPAFDADPALLWIREILSDNRLAGDEKMDLIDEHLLFGTGVPR